MDGGRGGAATKEGTLGQKLRRGVLISKRGGSSTPVRILSTTTNPSSSAHISARKLAAALYELHHYLPNRTYGTDGHVDLEASHFMTDQRPSSSNQDRFPVAIQSVREKLQPKRESRKLSENLHQKSASEMSETQRSLLNAVKELEAERKSRMLLENLCDEFAVRIRDYEHELHALKTKYDEEWTGDRSGLILHIAESWLDERTQMKMEEARTGFAEKTSVVDRLRSELDEARLIKPRDPTKRQVRFEEQMSRASLLGCAEKDGTQVGELRKNQFVRLDETECGEASCSNSGWRSQDSLVRPWMVRLSSPGIQNARSSSKLHPSSLEKKAKFKEGRT